MDNNVKEVHYQGRWDLRAQTTCKHVAPITVLKEREQKVHSVRVSQETILNSIIKKNSRSNKLHHIPSSVQYIRPETKKMDYSIKRHIIS